MKVIIISAVVLFLTQASFAKRIEGFDGDSKFLPNSTYALSAVQEHVKLVQSQKGDSDLRVSFVVMDNGGSTDVSPHARLFLTMHNESEMRDSSSVHPIASINNLQKVERVAPGIYRAYYSTYYDQDGVDCTNSYDFQGNYVVTIDARFLSQDVRNFKGAESDFSHSYVKTAVDAKYACQTEIED